MKSVLLSALWAAALLGSCSVPQRGTDFSKFVHAVMCSMDELTTTHVTALLKAQGIPCVIWGSIVYTVDVPAQDVDRARRILWNEAIRRPLSIGFDVALDNSELAEETSESLTLNLRHEALLKEATYSVDTDLGAVLRHEEIVKASKLFPVVVSVTSTAKEYLDLDQRYKMGHDFEIVLGEKADEESHRLFYQARDGGKGVLYSGGFGKSYGY